MPRAPAEKDGSALAQGLADHIQALTADLLGAPIRKDDGEWTFGREHGALRVTVTGPNRGTWCDVAQGDSGGPLALVRHCRGVSHAEARDWARAWLDGAAVRTPARRVVPPDTGDKVEPAQHSAEAQAIAHEAVAAAEIRTADRPAPRYGAPTHDLHDARTQARRAVEAWVSEAYRYTASERAAPPEHLVRITAGGGKSRIVRAVLTRRLSHFRFHARHQGNAAARAMTGGIVAVPTHELAQETASALHAQGVSAVVWRGREHVDADGHPACGNLEAVADAQAAHTPIESSACRRRLGDGEVLECPLYQHCAYQLQKPAAQAAEVVVLTHASLCHEPPAALGGRAWLVIDESFADGASRGGPGAALTLDALAEAPAPGLAPAAHDRLARLRRRAAAALADAPDGPVATRVLEDGGIAAADCRDAAGLEYDLKVEPDLYPGQAARDRAPAVQQAATHNRLVDRRARVWKLLADALERGLPAAGGVELGRHETAAGDARAVIPRWHTTIRTGWPKAVLYLDATPRPAIARRHLPRLETVAELEVDAPHLRVVQIPDAPHTRRKLDPGAQNRRRDQKRTERHLRDLHAYVQRKAREHDGGQVLVVAQERVEAALAAYRFRPNVELRHFNALRGLNAYSAHACLIVIGRPLPAAPAIEAEAAALTNEAPVARPEAGWWYDRVRAGVRRRDGGMDALTTPIHPDPFCEQLRRQVCEDELVQVIGRLRGINRGPDEPAEVVLLNDIVLPVTLDAIQSWETAAPDPLDLQLAHGVAVANASHAARLRPDLWPSAEAARKAVARSRTHRTHDSQERDVRFLGALTGTYQRDTGGAKAVSFVFDPTLVAEPAAAIEAAVGDLAFCDYDVEASARRRMLPPSRSGATTSYTTEAGHLSEASDTCAGGAKEDTIAWSGDLVPDEWF